MLAESSIDNLAKSLDMMSYMPQPYWKVQFPKPSGEFRSLSIPSWTDRIVALALLKRLSKAIEPVLSDACYAYRPGKGVAAAIQEVRTWRRRGFCWAAKVDIKDCFPNIKPWHVESSLRRVKASVAEREIVRRFLTRPLRSRFGIEPPNGLPQGVAFSPLLCNLVLSGIDRGIEREGLVHARYGDDILLASVSATGARAALDSAWNHVHGQGLSPATEKSLTCRIARETTWLGRETVAHRPVREATFAVA